MCLFVFVCVCVCVCVCEGGVGGCVRACVYVEGRVSMYARRIVSMDKILRFINTLIIIHLFLCLFLYYFVIMLYMSVSTDEEWCYCWCYSFRVQRNSLA